MVSGPNHFGATPSHKLYANDVEIADVTHPGERERCSRTTAPVWDPIESVKLLLQQRKVKFVPCLIKIGFNVIWQEVSEVYHHYYMFTAQ